MTLSKDNQWKLVIQGLAAGCLALHVAALPSGKRGAESAFRRAWGQWSAASSYPSVSSRDFYIYACKSERRRVAVAAFDWGRELRPYLFGGYTHWELDEALELIASGEDASPDEWKELAALFISEFK